MVLKKKKNKKAKSSGKGGFPGEKPLKPVKSALPAFRRSATTYFLTYSGKASDSGQNLTKETLADYLLNHNPNDRKIKPEKYLICQQKYDSGESHYHAILIYPKRRQVLNQDHYDYLGIHPNIQTMRNMKAAIQYVHKQDPHPVTNMDMINQRRKARAKDSSSIYELLQEQMVKDPWSFDVGQYCVQHNITKQIYKASYAKAINLIRMVQPAHCHKLLTEMPGIKPINRELIQASLTPFELLEYDAWLGYSQIVSHINQITRWPNKGRSTRAPNKTRHLCLVGATDIGKSALVSHQATPQLPFPGLEAYVPTFHLTIGEKYFPPYREYTNSLVSWQQFVIDSPLFPKKRYNELLVYLDGNPTKLPLKGAQAARRMDNPKHILTSNRTLQQQICATFKSQQNRAMARMNLRSRVHEVIVPPGKNLHFLRKLFVPASGTPTAPASQA